MSKVTPLVRLSPEVRQQRWYGHLTGTPAPKPSEIALAKAQRALHQPVSDPQKTWNLVHDLATVLPSWKKVAAAISGARTRIDLRLHPEGPPVFFGYGRGPIPFSITFNHRSDACPADYFSQLCFVAGEALPLPEHYPQPPTLLHAERAPSADVLGTRVWINNETRRLLGRSFALQALLEARSIGLRCHGKPTPVHPIDLAYYRVFRDGGFPRAMRAHLELIDPLTRLEMQQYIHRRVGLRHARHTSVWESIHTMLGTQWPSWPCGTKPDLQQNPLDDLEPEPARSRGYYTQYPLAKADPFFPRRAAHHLQWLMGETTNTNDIQRAFDCLACFAPRLAQRLQPAAQLRNVFLSAIRSIAPNTSGKITWPISRFQDPTLRDTMQVDIPLGIPRMHLLPLHALALWVGSRRIPLWPTVDQSDDYSCARGLFARFLAMKAHTNTARFELVFQARQRGVDFRLPNSYDYDRDFLERHGMAVYAARLPNLPGREANLQAFDEFLAAVTAAAGKIAT